MKPRDIIQAWPSRRTLAQDIGTSLSAVHHWHDRNRIPARYDLPLVVAARRRGLALTLEDLAAARFQRADATPAAQPAQSNSEGA